jgi:hypothetical protein
MDARARDRGALRQGLRRAARIRLRGVCGGAHAVHPGVGLPGDGYRAGCHPRDGPRNGPLPPRHARAPRRCSEAGGAKADSTRR